VAPISVVIPCYLCHSHLERAVESVLKQTLLPNEIVLVDDASPDAGKTKELIGILENQINKSHSKISVLTIFLKKNSGPGGARNAGWEIATQPWVAFLDADDTWDFRKIALQYGCIQSHSQIDLIAHKSAYIGAHLRKKSSLSSLHDHIVLKRMTLKMMLISNHLPTRSVMLRREIPMRFPENSGLSEDYSLWLDIIAASYDARIMNCTLAYTFRPEHSDGGYSGQLWTQEKRELASLYRFHKLGNLSAAALYPVMIWSLLKFARRLINRFTVRLLSL